MRKLLGFSGGRAFVALCLLLLVAVPMTLADDTANVLYIHGPLWPSTTLRVFALEGDTTLRVSDCASFGAYTRTLPWHGSLIAEDLAANLCSTAHEAGDTAIGVATLPVSAGSAKISTEAIFEDAQGILNVVRIPSLPQAIDESIDTINEYEFDSIQNGGGMKTYLAIITDNYGHENFATVELEVRDGDNLLLASEYVDVNGFAWYALQTPVKIGNVVMRVVPQTIGPAPASAKVYSVAFVGLATGGGPDVIVPARFAVTTP
jgi:hypothetical protein